jgi:hypothetical protein
VVSEVVVGASAVNLDIACGSILSLVQTTLKSASVMLYGR